MIGRVFWEVLLFLLPFALYFLYTRVARRDDEGKLPHAHPWTWLFIAGLALAIAGLVWLGLARGSGSTDIYVPAHEVNGEVVPGHYQKSPPPPEPL